MGGFRPNENDFRFSLYHNSIYTTDLDDLGGKLIIV